MRFRNRKPSISAYERIGGFFMTKLIVAGCLSIFIGTRILAEDAAPKRIVSLAPSYDEILIELGLQDRIVGVTTSSDYLEEVRRAERIGLWVKPNIERIVALKPDLILATGFAGQQSAAEKLSALGLRVVVLDETQGIAEIFAKTRQIGDILKEPARTAALLKRMRATVATTRRLTAALPSRPRVYMETGYDPLFTCGKGSFIHEMIEAAGGQNIAGAIAQPFPRISSEFVINSDPEVIILPYMGRNFGKEALKQRKGWEKISAIKTGRVYDDIGPQVITIPSPRLILYGLPELLKRIHPEIIQGANKE
jgi:iron complex transport system substrate-binding protein